MSIPTKNIRAEKITGSFDASGIAISGSLTSISAASFTGSLQGTASNAVSASFATSASFAGSGVGSFSGSFSGSFVGNGSQLTGLPIPPPSIRRHDFTGSYSYCGTADSGSAESSPVWDITRITFQPSGTGSISEYAYDVTWTGRYTHIYT